MSEQYSHTLIAKQKDFTPSPIQVHKFLSAMVTQGVVPGVPTIVLRKPTGKFREYPIPDPLTGQKLKLEIKDRKKLDALDEISKAVESIHDYELEIAGFGRPALAPLPIEFAEAYQVGITCFVYSTYRSTSDPHDDADGGDKVTGYNKPCLELPTYGYFNKPDTLEVLKVPEAGYARFWMQFELGKFLLPEIKNGDLNLLNPHIVTEAENVFGLKFVQGCCWYE